MSIVNIKWEIIQIKVEKKNQIIPIDFKLANEIKACNGISLSVKELLNTNDNYISQVGELSLSINAKQIHPLHLTVQYSKDLSDKKESLKLNCELESNKNITGFYIDYANLVDRKKQFIPYTLSIYLECSDQEAITEPIK